MQEMIGRQQRQGTRLASLLVVSLALGAMGAASLYRQASSRVPEIGFWVADSRGMIQVEPGGPAAGAGLESGDRLASIDGTAFSSPFTWNESLVAGPEPRSISVDVWRGQARIAVLVPLEPRRGNPIYYYLAVVGFFFLATATVAGMRAARSTLAGHYYLFSLSIFAVLALSDTTAGTTLDWALYLGDRLGRLAFAPLFFLLAVALGLRQRLSWWKRLIVWSPPAVVALVSVALFWGIARGRVRDPLGLWLFKDRVELLMISAFLLAGLSILGWSVRRENAAHRRYLLRWAFWGSLIGFAPLVFVYLIPAGLGSAVPTWAELSALSLVALPVTLSSTLFRLRRGDLELYLKRAVTALSVAFLTLAVFGAAVVLLDRIGGHYLNLSDWIRTGIAALAAAILYPKVRGLTHQAIDRLVYGGRYSFRRTLLSFGRELNAELDLEALAKKFQDRTRETLDLDSAFVLVRHDREKVLKLAASDAADLVVQVDSPLIERIRGVSFLLLEELSHAPGAERLEWLRSRGAHYLFPMKVKGEVRAVLATGARRGGEPLNTEDIELLVALCGHAAIAIESARLFAALQAKVEEVESLRRYNQNIVESSRIGILVVDGQGRIQALNPSLAEIYGMPREEAIGRALGEVFPLPLVRNLAQRGDRLGEPSNVRQLYRHPLTDVKGRRMIVNISVSRLTAGDGERPGHVITFDDVTEQVRMEERLLRQDKLASIGLLAAGVAHEINTPLTGISSYSQILLSELDPADPRVEILKKIERQTFRAASIVHSLLNFTRDGSGVSERVVVGELIEESLALFEPQLRGRKIAIERKIEEGLPPLSGSRGKLQQVLLNLLLNARDAITESGTIAIRARRAGSRLVLEVADDGHGIAEEDLGRVFDPFFTTKPRGRGTGLGLSLSYNIVQEHRGEITVESRPGEGAVFTVDLPLEGRDAIHA